MTVKKQWIRLSNNIELLDTPGVLWPKFESQEVALNLVFTGTIKEEILDKEESAFYLIKYLTKNNLSKLCAKYKLQEEEIKELIENAEDENECTLDIIEMIGKSRGALASGGRIDMKKTSNLILQDFREGRVGRITLETLERR